MKYFRVALLQMTAGASQAENLEKGQVWCRRAKAMGADLALFPEMWNCGYAVDRPDLEALAIRRDDPFSPGLPGPGRGAGDGHCCHLPGAAGPGAPKHRHRL